MTETGDQQGGALPPQHFIPPARLLFSVTLAERNGRSMRSAAAKSNPYWSEPPELRPSAPRRRGFLIEPPQPPAPSPAAGLAFLKGPRRHPDSQKAALCRSAWKGSHGPESSAPLRIKTERWQGSGGGASAGDSGCTCRSPAHKFRVQFLVLPSGGKEPA